MSLLYTELKNIYNKKDYLNRTSPLEEFHVSLKTFLISELKKQTKYFNPYKFAMNYSMNPRGALNIFLAISKDSNLLKQYFAIECDCGGIRIVESLDSMIFCDECYNEIVFENETFLQNINILFALGSQVKKELQFDLKHQSSSVEVGYIKEEDYSRNPSIQDILTIPTEGETPEETEDINEFAEKMRRKMRIGS